MTATIKERSELAAVLIPKLRLCISESITAEVSRRAMILRIATALGKDPSTINGWLAGSRNNGPPRLSNLMQIQAWLAKYEAEKAAEEAPELFLADPPAVRPDSEANSCMNAVLDRLLALENKTQPPAANGPKQHVLQEFDELSSKSSALVDFLNSDAFHELSIVQRVLLRNQYDVMTSYILILRQRLKYWDE